MRVASLPLLIASGLVLVASFGVCGCAERERPVEQQSVATVEPPPVAQPRPVAVPLGMQIKRPMMGGARIDRNMLGVVATAEATPAAAPPPSASTSASQ